MATDEWWPGSTDKWWPQPEERATSSGGGPVVPDSNQAAAPPPFRSLGGGTIQYVQLSVSGRTADLAEVGTVEAFLSLLLPLLPDDGEEAALWQAMLSGDRAAAKALADRYEEAGKDRKAQGVRAFEMARWG